ncbi:MAG TPA: aspartate-semialdehyde dehydrogenase [Vicinamibacterales bacterium]|nr:aspartate-semialdehyde dehydrogenase [Vicinamibacterales bacterium]
MISHSEPVSRRIDVGILGATGMVGQQFIRLLDGHPWFRAAWLAASERSEGRTYRQAAAWHLPTPPPADILGRQVEGCVPGRAPRLVFSGLDAAAATDIEPAFAAAGHIVVSNARSYRMDPLVPLVIPEVNGDHLALLEPQRKGRGWSGAIVTNPNCSTVVLAMVLAPLRHFGLTRVTVTTLQAVSGAGYPGVPSLDILGNVIPFISGEEEKMESETQKILGRLEGPSVVPHPVVVSAQTTRVPVIDGHTISVSLGFDGGPTPADVREALAGFRAKPQELALPSAPPSPILLLDDDNRPQPRLDVERENGMVIAVGRVRRCPVLGVKLIALGHNTVRGAAGAALLNAELMVAEGIGHLD